MVDRIRLLCGIGSSLVLLGLAGCNSDPTLYNLSAWPGAPAPARLAVVEVHTPVVAKELDRDRIVRQTKDYKLKVSDSDAWSDAPGQIIARSLSDDLAQRLPGTTVFAQNDANPAVPQAFVDVTVTAFSRDRDGNAVFGGTLVVHGVGQDAAPHVIPFSLKQSASGSTMSGLIAGLSAECGQLADMAAQALREMPIQTPAG